VCHTIFAWLLSFHGWSKAWPVVESYAGFYVCITAWFVFDVTSPVGMESLKRVLDVNVVILSSERNVRARVSDVLVLA
jgi:hypothetical protein